MLFGQSLHLVLAHLGWRVMVSQTYAGAWVFSRKGLQVRHMRGSTAAALAQPTTRRTKLSVRDHSCRLASARWLGVWLCCAAVWGPGSCLAAIHWAWRNVRLPSTVSRQPTTRSVQPQCGRTIQYADSPVRESLQLDTMNSTTSAIHHQGHLSGRWLQTLRHLVRDPCQQHFGLSPLAHLIS